MQKRPIILRSLLIEATPYSYWYKLKPKNGCDPIIGIGTARVSAPASHVSRGHPCLHLILKPSFFCFWGEKEVTKVYGVTGDMMMGYLEKLFPGCLSSISRFLDAIYVHIHTYTHMHPHTHTHTHAHTHAPTYTQTHTHTCTHTHMHAHTQHTHSRQCTHIRAE